MKNIQEKDIFWGEYRIHLWEGGSGPTILLFHGSGPGASTLGNWRLILDKLASRCRVIAVDFIGFGMSDKKVEPPFFDYKLWLDQVRYICDWAQAEGFSILAHSLAASICLRVAADDKRVDNLITTGAMGARFEVNEATVTTWTFPENREALRRAGEYLVFDKSVVNEEYLDGRTKILFEGDFDYQSYFKEMFAGDKQKYVDASIVPDDVLKKVRCPVLMVHGRDDEPYPFENLSLSLSRKIDNADLYSVARCGHSVGIEYPDKLLQLIYSRLAV